MEVCNMADLTDQSIQSIIMKLAVVLFACVAVAFAQQHGGNQGGNHGGMQHGGHGPDAIMHMIHMEVQALMQANPGMSSADCIKKCDDMFDLMDSTDESSTATTPPDNPADNTTVALDSLDLCSAFKNYLVCNWGTQLTQGYYKQLGLIFY